MSNVRRYPLGSTRELRIVSSAGRIWIAVWDLNVCRSGPLAIGADETDTLRSALGDLGADAASEEATEEAGKQ